MRAAAYHTCRMQGPYHDTRRLIPFDLRRVKTNEYLSEYFTEAYRFFHIIISVQGSGQNLQIRITLTSVFDQKIHALDAHESQFYEWLPWIGGYLAQVPKDKATRKNWLAENRSLRITPAVRTSLEKWYGSGAGNVKHAEAFEICEYGTQPSEVDLRRLFPMLGGR